MSMSRWVLDSLKNYRKKSLENIQDHITKIVIVTKQNNMVNTFKWH